jgi:hypothetical protein
MPTGETFWDTVKNLSEALDGYRERSERTLEELHAKLKALPADERNEIRRQMILIVAGLSRLAIRLVDSDGPLDVAI